MGKGSGGTRIKIPGGTQRSVSGGASLLNNESLNHYNSYNENEWEHTAFYPENGGFLITSLSRIQYGQKNKNEKDKFLKEQRMCKRYAQWGFQIKHNSEISGISSPDVDILKHGIRTVVNVNGKRADLKSLSSANNIVRHAKDAIFKQHADIVMFEFTKHDKDINRELNKLKDKGIHGYYYYSDEDRYRSF